MENSSLKTKEYHKPRLLQKRALQSVPVIAFFPFFMILFRLIDSHTVRIGAAVVVCFLVFSAILFVSIRLHKIRLITGMVLILPMYFCMCAAFSDFPYFQSRTVMTSFTKSLSPGSEFILGTDYEGRDILSTIVIGGMNAYLVAVVATLIALIAGVPTGLLLSKNNIVMRQLASVVTQLRTLASPMIISKRCVTR